MKERSLIDNTIIIIYGLIVTPFIHGMLSFIGGYMAEQIILEHNQYKKKKKMKDNIVLLKNS